MESKIRYGRWVVVVLAIGVVVTAARWWGWRRSTPSALGPGHAAYERRDWHEAFRAANRYLRLRPEDPAALQLAARSAIRSGRGELAQALYSQLGLQAMNSEDFVLMGRELTRTGQTDAAWAVIERVRASELEDPELLHALARLYASADRLDQATEVVQRLVANTGWEARGAVLTGLLRSEQSDPEGAITALTDALRRDPALQDAVVPVAAVRKLLARSYLQVGQPAEAQEQLETVLARGPDTEAIWLLSRALLQQHALGDAEQALERAGDYAEQAGATEPAAFIGADRCTKCHPDVSHAQRDSRHAQTFVRHSQLHTLPLPEAPVTDSGDARVSHTLAREHDRIVLETTADGKSFRSLVEYAIGSEDRVRTPLVRDEQGRIFECRLSRYARSAEGAVWEKSSGQPDEITNSDDFLGRLLSADALRRCLHCHATNVPAARDGIGPAAEDLGISCERCHGPGAHHVLAVAAGFSDLAIARPGSGAGVLRLCGECHSPRGGMISSEDPNAVRFQAAGLMRSRCYTASQGKLDCMTCHDPHQDAGTSAAFYESKCLECHAPMADPSAAPEITRSVCPVNSKADCLGCHMPPAEKVMPHTSFTDHEIRIRK